MDGLEIGTPRPRWACFTVWGPDGEPDSYTEGEFISPEAFMEAVRAEVAGALPAAQWPLFAAAWYAEEAPPDPPAMYPGFNCGGYTVAEAPGFTPAEARTLGRWARHPGLAGGRLPVSAALLTPEEAALAAREAAAMAEEEATW